MCAIVDKSIGVKYLLPVFHVNGIHILAAFYTSNMKISPRTFSYEYII